MFQVPTQIDWELQMTNKFVGVNLVGIYAFCSDATIFTLIYS